MIDVRNKYDVCMGMIFKSDNSRASPGVVVTHVSWDADPVYVSFSTGFDIQILSYTDFMKEYPIFYKL